MGVSLTVALTLMVIVIRSSLIGCATEINRHFCENYCWYMTGGIMTQRRGVILSNRSKRFGKHVLR